MIRNLQVENTKLFGFAFLPDSKEDFAEPLEGMSQASALIFDRFRQHFSLELRQVQVQFELGFFFGRRLHLCSAKKKVTELNEKVCISSRHIEKWDIYSE